MNAQRSLLTSSPARRCTSSSRHWLPALMMLGALLTPLTATAQPDATRARAAVVDLEVHRPGVGHLVEPLHDLSCDVMGIPGCPPSHA